jgi:hypothetical protein
LPQGSLKKIELHLLLADLALELGYPTFSPRQRVARRRLDRGEILSPRRPGTMRLDRQRFRLGRPSPTAQRLRATSSKSLTPLIEILPPNAKFARQRAHILP